MADECRMRERLLSMDKQLIALIAEADEMGQHMLAIHLASAHELVAELYADLRK